MKNRNWEKLKEWLGDFNLFDVKSDFLKISTDTDDQIQAFEMVISLIFAEYHKGLQTLLRSENTVENEKYLESLKKVQHLIRLLYHDFTLFLSEQTQTSYNLKLFLHVVYEIDSSVHFLKDIFLSQRDHISEIIGRDDDKDQRKFEKIYQECDMKLAFENLLTWFEERT